MSFAPTVEEQELLADSYQRAGSRMTARERYGELVIGVGFAAAVAAVWAISPPHGFRVLSAALCMAVLAVATMVRFDTPFGFTVPTQVAFVPLVFAVPAAIVPLAVVAALALGRLSEVVTGEIPPKSRSTSGEYPRGRAGCRPHRRCTVVRSRPPDRGAEAPRARRGARGRRYRRRAVRRVGRARPGRSSSGSSGREVPH